MFFFSTHGYHILMLNCFQATQSFSWGRKEKRTRTQTPQKLPLAKNPNKKNGLSNGPTFLSLSGKGYDILTCTMIHPGVLKIVFKESRYYSIIVDSCLTDWQWGFTWFYFAIKMVFWHDDFWSNTYHHPPSCESLLNMALWRTQHCEEHRIACN